MIRRAAALAAALTLVVAVCGTDAPHPRQAAADYPGSEAVQQSAPASMAACAECHGRIVHRYLQNGMAHTLGPLSELDELPPAGSKSNPRSRFTYTVDGAPGSLAVTQTQSEPPDGLPQHKRSQPVLHYIGAGVLDRSFISVDQQRWFFTPLEYFTEHGWELSPTEHRPVPHGLGRPITYECLACHTSAPVPQPYPLHALGEYTPEPIDCSGCHGDSALHVARMRSGDPTAETGIINPKYLPPARQLDICARCHLQGDARLELDPGDQILAGSDLLALRPVFVTAQPTDDFGFVSQTQRLALSECFADSPAMTCTTCHDPHLPARLQPRSDFVDACKSCHSQPHSSKPVSTGDQDCVQCHMRRSQPFDLEHVAVHDHWIRSQPPAPASHDAIRETESRGGIVKRFAYRAGDSSPFSSSESNALLAAAKAHLGDMNGAQRALGGVEPGDWRSTTGAFRSPLIHFMRARVLQAQGDAAGAASSYRAALALDAGYAPARVNLAELLLSTGALDEARRHVEFMTRAHPLAEIPWNLLAMIEQRSDDLAASADALEQSLRRNANQAGAWHTLAQIRQALRQFEPMQEAYKRAYAIDPHFPGLADLMAELQRQFR